MNTKACHVLVGTGHNEQVDLSEVPTPLHLIRETHGALRPHAQSPRPTEEAGSRSDPQPRRTTHYPRTRLNEAPTHRGSGFREAEPVAAQDSFRLSPPIPSAPSPDRRNNRPAEKSAILVGCGRIGLAGSTRISSEAEKQPTPIASQQVMSRTEAYT